MSLLLFSPTLSSFQIECLLWFPQSHRRHFPTVSTGWEVLGVQLSLTDFSRRNKPLISVGLQCGDAVGVAMHYGSGLQLITANFYSHAFCNEKSVSQAITQLLCWNRMVWPILETITIIPLGSEAMETLFSTPVNRMSLRYDLVMGNISSPLSS